MKRRETMRVEPKVMRAVNILAGERQVETGENISISEAIWDFIKAHRPDVANRADNIGENGENGDGKDDETI